jgi:hypothetical protein
MSIIECKCPNCGAPIKVDSSSDASYCEFCKTPFITEKAIHVHGDYVREKKVITNNTYNDNKDYSWVVMVAGFIFTFAFICLLMWHT